MPLAVIALLSLLAVTGLAPSVRAQEVPLHAATLGEGIGDFPSDQFGSFVSCGGRHLGTWDPLGARGREAVGYNTYVVISNRAETATPVGYTLTAAPTGCQPVGIANKISSDPSVVVLADDTSNAPLSRVSRFTLPRLGSFEVTLTQTVTATKLTRTYAVKNLEAVARSLTVTTTTDSDIEFGRNWYNDVGFHRFSVPREVGMTSLDGRIGMWLRLFGGDFQGWRVWQARYNGVYEVYAVAGRLGIPDNELNVFARTREDYLPAGAAHHQDGSSSDFAFQTDHGADPEHDGFTQLAYLPYNVVGGLNGPGGGDIALSLQTVLHLAAGATETFSTEYEFFGEVATSVVTTDVDVDLVPDFTDNCPFDANPDQADAWGDGVGDACLCDDQNASCAAPWVYGVVRTAGGLGSIRCRAASGGAVECDTTHGVLTVGPPMCGAQQ